MNKIFSGIRPSGKLHLGNYLGAIKNWIALQDDPQTERAIYAVVDLHGITTPYDPKTFHEGVMDVILDYLAAGINPEKSLLIRQSHVHQHAELAWLFNTITPVSWLDRLPTYKEKMEQTGGKYNHMGLLDYPVLMAADILLYKSNLVPVGDDQKAHIDLTNEIGKKFNSMFGATFDPVKTIKAEGARIMSLKDSSKKMSKTGDEGIALSDDSDMIQEKIKKAVTDESGIANLKTIYRLLAGQEPKIEENNNAKFKKELADVIVEFLKPFQTRRADLAKNLDHVESILKSSEEKARVIAEQTLVDVKSKMGL
ncbi:MAG: tryptophan--tRNA ligase [Candidatus Yanofskybacteria bacterium RIFCSPLOWO2_01_FULL_49_25]|uniref:Tryptophan--tRNA ligase n=1 Tax=Candidatus Yanofskybacteria bacterium RIFCSPLOWO2_01_FULL_49_25 TaxID=1802701 RepID=A0A1F8GV09_9BACT|nr:MAG: tryptophan--tRNA ligase [Candidatus Yanofskybacteria bacterium RIFCSPLOWO2_01_FULL_49_25]